MVTVLKVEKRELRPRAVRTQLRGEGKVPAVVYGNMMDSQAISIDSAEFSKALRENGLNDVYSLELDGKKIPTLIRDYKTDTFTSQWVHIEFLAVDLNEEQEVEADIALVGTPKGVKVGGTLAQNLFTAKVLAVPQKLPDTIEVNVEALEIGDSLTIGDIPENPDYKIVTGADEQIASVEAPREEVEEIPGEEVAPEVIGEAKE